MGRKWSYSSGYLQASWSCDWLTKNRRRSAESFVEGRTPLLTHQNFSKYLIHILVIKPLLMTKLPLSPGSRFPSHQVQLRPTPFSHATLRFRLCGIKKMRFERRHFSCQKFVLCCETEGSQESKFYTPNTKNKHKDVSRRNITEAVVCFSAFPFWKSFGLHWATLLSSCLNVTSLN